MRCRKCGHVRNRLDPLPETQCADCGAPYPASEQDSIALERSSSIRATSRRAETGGGLKWALKLFAIMVVVILVRHWVFPGELAKAAGKQIVAGQQPEVVLY